jgi:AmmeMemoRadiSam system protein B
VIRAPAVAGTFYPADPARLRRLIDDLLGGAVTPEAPPPQAVIVPHAGYAYSGPVAATAYNLLRRTRPEIRRVVMAGPAHFVWVDGVALPQASALATPLGEIAVDAEAEAWLRTNACVVDSRLAHDPEHCLEVQLPFLQTLYEDFVAAAMLCGHVDPREVAPLLEHFLGEEDTLVLVSSDLSHYFDYEEAHRRDEATAEAICSLRPEDLGADSACGLVAVQALLLAARNRDLQVTQLDLRSSGDTAGDRSRVVGYGSFSLA